MPEGQPLPGRQVAARADRDGRCLPLRPTERGILADVGAARMIWTADTSEKGRMAAVAPPVHEWLMIRLHEEGKRSSARTRPLVLLTPL